MVEQEERALSSPLKVHSPFSRTLLNSVLERGIQAKQLILAHDGLVCKRVVSRGHDGAERGRSGEGRRHIRMLELVERMLQQHIQLQACPLKAPALHKASPAHRNQWNCSARTLNTFTTFRPILMVTMPAPPSPSQRAQEPQPSGHPILQLAGLLVMLWLPLSCLVGLAELSTA